MRRKLRRWWWTKARGSRYCGACGFCHPYPERWHHLPYDGRSRPYTGDAP